MTLNNFYSASKFDIRETIQSQYACSQRISKLALVVWQAIDPASDIELMYDRMINPLSAVGAGLDVWGHIVGVPRSIQVKRLFQNYLGFNYGGYSVYLNSFNNAPFYNKNWYDSVDLSDTAYRLYIFVKAASNISTSTLYDINFMCKQLIPKGVKVIHSGTMALRVIITSGTIDQTALAAFLGLKWSPTGVGVDRYDVIGPVFGFNGSKLQPLNHGTFISTRPISIDF